MQPESNPGPVLVLKNILVSLCRWIRPCGLYKIRIKQALPAGVEQFISVAMDNKKKVSMVAAKKKDLYQEGWRLAVRGFLLIFGTFYPSKQESD